jgi:F-type H+-transporting ATPase subunit epsilon
VVTIFSDTAIRASDLNEAKALEAKQRAEAAMEDATENQDISATQAALAGLNACVSFNTNFAWL